VGPTRSGKSFTMNYMVTMAVNMGDHVTIVDIGHSYKRTCEFLGGRYFDSAKKELFHFNIFLTDKDSKGNYLYNQQDENVNPVILRILTVINIIWKTDQKFTVDEENMLVDLIEKYYDLYVNEKKIFPKLSSFYDFIDIYVKQYLKNEHKDFMNFESLKLALNRFAFGEYEYLMNGDEPIDIFRDKLVIFDLEAIKDNKKILKIITFLISDLQNLKISKLKGVRKRFLVDEALDMLLDDFMGNYIAYLFRTFGKKEGQIGLLAQNIEFFDNLPPMIRSSIQINCDTKVFLTHKNNPASIKIMVNGGWIAPGDAEKMESVVRGQAFIKTGDISRVVNVELSTFANYTYTSWETEVKDIEKLKDKYDGNLAVAIEEYSRIKTKEKNENKS